MILMIEAQVTYILDALQQMRRQHLVQGYRAGFADKRAAEQQQRDAQQRPAPGVGRGQAIDQGDDADNVFIIIEGHAEALVDGQKVGDVQRDEIFGAMAVFTQEKRSASVIATVPCTVMLIPKDQFLGLMQSNPKIAHSLIESMARRIDLLNKEVTQLRLPISA